MNPSDAGLDLPRSTIVAGWIMAGIGVLSIGGFIYGLFVGACMINLAVLELPAGLAIVRKKRNGWRKFAAFCAWLTMAGGALMLGATLIGKQPLEFNVGSSISYLPIWVGVLFSLAMLGLGVFLFLALTHPLAHRICIAASSPDATRREQRIADLTHCQSCKHNTTQTVIDGLYDCPECGKSIRYNETEQAWVREHRDIKS